MPGHHHEQGFDLHLWPSRLEQPLHWRRPRRVFVNSMSDLFHEDIPDSYIAQIFDVMGRAHWHTFQALTERHDRLAELAPALDWHPNVWMGVTIENRRFVKRADALRTAPRPPVHRHELSPVARAPPGRPRAMGIAQHHRFRQQLCQRFTEYITPRWRDLPDVRRSAAWANPVRRPARRVAVDHRLRPPAGGPRRFPHSSQRSNAC
jgi:hypothetical protein